MADSKKQPPNSKRAAGIGTQASASSSSPPTPDAPPPATQGSLSDYKSRALSDEAMVYFRSGSEPYFINRNALDRELGKEYRDIMERSLFIVPARDIQTFAQRRSLMNRFELRGLPDVYLPWLRKKSSPEQFLAQMLEIANVNTLVHVTSHCNQPDLGNIIADLAIHLGQQYPEHPVLKKFTSDESLTSLRFNSDYQNEFYRELVGLPEFETAAGAQKLNRALAETLPQHGQADLYEYNMHTAPELAGGALGFTNKQINRFASIAELTVLSGPLSGQKRLHFILDDEKLKAEADALIKTQSKTLLKEYRRALNAAGKQLPKLISNLSTRNFEEKPLSQPQAKAMLDQALASIPLDSLAARAMKLAMQNPELEIVILPGEEANAYWANFGRTKKTIEENHNVRGYSHTDVDKVYITSGSLVRTTIEEVLHNAMGKLYDSTDQITYPDSIKVGDDRYDDVRRTLFTEAMTSDLNRIGRNVDIMRQHLGLPRSSYKGSSFHAEVIIKILVMKAIGEWTDAHARLYAHLDRYVEQIVAKDIAGWEQAHSEGNPLTSLFFPLVNENVYRHGMPPIKEKQEFTPYRTMEFGGEKYHVVHDDCFAINNHILVNNKRVGLLKVIEERVPGLKIDYSDIPSADRMTVKDTPQGKLIIIPDELFQKNEALRLTCIYPAEPPAPPPNDIAGRFTARARRGTNAQASHQR